MEFMMRVARHFYSLAVLASILCASVLCLNACEHSLQTFKRPNMTALSTRLQPLFEKTRSVCFSHFILDIPANATLIYGPADVDLPIEYYPGEGDNVAKHVEAHIREVEMDRRLLSRDDLAKFLMFGQIMDGAMPGQKLVFGSKNQAFYSVDSFVPLGKDLFVQHASTGLTKDEAIRSFNMAASRLRLRADDEMPTEPGACIEGGFIAWQPDFERSSIGVRLKEFPDVHFSIRVTKNQDYIVESSALESRLDRAANVGGTWYTRIKFFRRGPRELGNWQGFEALARKPAEGKNTDSHQFAFVSLGAVNDPLQPSLDVQLDTGVKDDQTASVKPSITDEEAIALWDKLIGSIRVRPTGAAAKQSGALPPKLPLGEYIDTGSVCPQAGWWQCSDGGEIAGGRRRHLAAGDPVPHAFVLGKPSLWQMFKGERPTHKIATIWKLVEYDPEPVVESPVAAAERHPESGTDEIRPSDRSGIHDATPPREA
jgi:hypothetical protein